MSTFILDYREEVCKLISTLYEPADELSKEFEYSTEKLTENIKAIMPCNAVDEHLIYECLKDLKFEPSEVPNRPLEFIWYFKRKNNF